MTDLKQLCIDLEHYETDPWAAEAVLKREILTGVVVDPCVGTGVLTLAARAAGYPCIAGDIHDWGFDGTIVGDFLSSVDLSGIVRGNTVFMNPPFSKAEAFVERAFAFGARKIVTFQRFAWWESRERKAFWDEFPPTKVYICGNRATCWRHDMTADQRKGKSTSSAHAFFVFESGHCGGTLLDRIYKPVKGV